MRPLSLDLRQRAVALYKQIGKYTEVAKLLLVRPGWVRSMVIRLENTGNLDNNCSNCGRKPSIDARGRALLASWLEAENDLILDELHERLRQEGYDCCRATVDNTLTAMKITRKKNNVCRRAESARCSGEAGCLGKRDSSWNSVETPGVS